MLFFLPESEMLINTHDRSRPSAPRNSLILQKQNHLRNESFLPQPFTKTKGRGGAGGRVEKEGKNEGEREKKEKLDR